MAGGTCTHVYIINIRLLTKLEVSVCRYNFPFDLWSNQGQLLLIIHISTSYIHLSDTLRKTFQVKRSGFKLS